MTVKDRIGTLEGVLTVRVDSRNPKTADGFNTFIFRRSVEGMRLSQELRFGKLLGETHGWISQSEIERHFNNKGNV